MSPELSICICTLDRADDLKNCLDALLRTEGVDCVEVLVVNNGPGERSRAVVDDYTGRLPLRYVRHEKPGCSEALNRAWREARAEWIAYIDDDTRVYPSWTKAILERIPHLGPECFAMAGNVDRGTPPPALPAWCHPQVAAAAFSNVDFGSEDRNLPWPSAPLGNNMGVRRSFLKRQGGFPPALRTYWEFHVSCLGYGEGGACFFNSGMRAAHSPSAARINPAWMLNKIRNSGRDYQLMARILPAIPQRPPRYDFFWDLPLIFLKLSVSWIIRSARHVLAFRALLNFNIGRMEMEFLKRHSVEYSTFRQAL